MKNEQLAKKIIVVLGDTAVVSSILTTEGIHGELVVRKNRNRVTDVWVREAKQWPLLASHRTRIPQNQ